MPCVAPRAEFVRSEGAPPAPAREDSGEWMLVDEDDKP